MTQAQQPDAPSRIPASPPICATCGRPMRLASAEPATHYSNINQVNYVCDCGETTNRIVADKD